MGPLKSESTVYHGCLRKNRKLNLNKFIAKRSLELEILGGKQKKYALLQNQGKVSHHIAAVKINNVNISMLARKSSCFQTKSWCELMFYTGFLHAAMSVNSVVCFCCASAARKALIAFDQTFTE